MWRPPLLGQAAQAPLFRQLSSNSPRFLPASGAAPLTAASPPAGIPPPAAAAEATALGKPLLRWTTHPFAPPLPVAVTVPLPTHSREPFACDLKSIEFRRDHGFNPAAPRRLLSSCAGLRSSSASHVVIEPGFCMFLGRWKLGIFPLFSFFHPVRHLVILHTW
jgi:hypothetical protein